VLQLVSWLVGVVGAGEEEGEREGVSGGRGSSVQKSAIKQQPDA